MIQNSYSGEQISPVVSYCCYRVTGMYRYAVETLAGSRTPPWPPCWRVLQSYLQASICVFASLYWYADCNQLLVPGQL